MANTTSITVSQPQAYIPTFSIEGYVLKMAKKYHEENPLLPEHEVQDYMMDLYADMSLDALHDSPSDWDC